MKLIKRIINVLEESWAWKKKILYAKLKLAGKTIWLYNLVWNNFLYIYFLQFCHNFTEVTLAHYILNMLKIWS